MHTVYQTHREGKELPESQWVIVVGEIDYRTGGTKRSPHLIANVFDKDSKPLLGDLEHAVVIQVGDGRFAIQGQQKATHEKGMYWDKQWYFQVLGCVPVKT